MSGLDIYRYLDAVEIVAVAVASEEFWVLSMPVLDLADWPALADVGCYAVYLDSGAPIVARVSPSEWGDIRQLGAGRALGGVIVLPKATPAGVLSREMHAEIPADGARDIVLCRDPEQPLPEGQIPATRLLRDAIELLDMMTVTG